MGKVLSLFQRTQRVFFFQEEPSWSNSRINLLNDAVYHLIYVIQSCCLIIWLFLFEVNKSVTMHSFTTWAFEWL